MALTAGAFSSCDADITVLICSGRAHWRLAQTNPLFSICLFKLLGVRLYKFHAHETCSCHFQDRVRSSADHSRDVVINRYT